MNTNLMDILVGETRGIASSDDGGGVDDILGPRPRPRPGDNGDDVRRREQQQQQQQLRGTTNYFGLNLGRSQSAAPETWEYAKFPPASARSAEGMGGDGGGLFGGGGGGGRGGHHRGFFDEEEEDREHAIMLQKLASRRPASTGVIGQRPGASDVGGGGGSSSSGDVDSILETLGFTSLELSGKQRPPPSSLGGIGDPTPAGPSSLVLGGAHLEKINEQRQGQDEGANYFAMTGHQRGETPSRSGNLLFVNNQGGGGGGGQMGLQGNVGPTSASSTMSAQQCQLEQMQPPPGLSEQGQGGGYFGQQQQQQQVHASQYVLQQPSSHVRQVHHQDQLPFDSQQQQQLYYSQDYRAQQQASMNMIHSGAVLQINPGQQQTIYHINAPSVSPYGFDYQTPQHPHLHQHVVPANHILLPQHQQISGGGGGQYISIVPIQAAQFGGGPPGHGHGPTQAYAYVQYGDGANPTTLVSASSLGMGGGGGGPGATTTYVMGPNGPIAVSSSGAPPGLAPISVVNYGGGGHHLGTSPPGGGGMRSPTRTGGTNGGGGGGATSYKSPDRTNGGPGGGGGGGRGGGWGGNKKNAVVSPRGSKQQQRGGPDKNASTPSRLGPEASHLLNEIRGAKSRSQWTIHDIRGHVVEFCLDQNGSRFIQQRLEVADSIEKDAVMDEIIPAMTELQNDVFGNYVVQKLYEFGTRSMKKDLKGTLTGNMLLLSLQMYG